MIDNQQLAELVNDVDLCTKAADGLMPLVWESTIPILLEQDGTYRQHGTGTLVRIAERSFLITAAHVFKHEYGLFVAGRNTGSGLMRLDGAFHCTADRPDGDDAFDLGIHELDKQEIDHLVGYRFVRLLDVVADDNLGPDLYCVGGFPTALATEANANQTTLQLQRFYCISYPYQQRSDLPGYNSRYHVVLHGQRDDAVPIGKSDLELPRKLHGISGCGIWKTNIAGIAGERWTPNHAKLVAVQTSVYTKSGAIKATIWRGVATMICRLFPELQPSLGLLLPRMGVTR